MHKGVYSAFGKDDGQDGIATYAIDMRGFGERKEIGGKTELDFDGSLADIKSALQQIHKKHPGLPVIMLGESMGGAIALRATALFPDLVAGLISSVPAKDRFSLDDGSKVGVKAGLQTMLGGFNKQMTDSAMAAVNKISEKERSPQCVENRSTYAYKFFAQKICPARHFHVRQSRCCGDG